MRTSGGVNVRAALEETAGVLVKFGGHKEACGLTVAPEHFETFRELFEAAVARQRQESVARTIAIDEVLSPREVAVALVEGLERLEPFGPGNPEPFFLVDAASSEVTAGLSPGVRYVSVGAALLAQLR